MNAYQINTRMAVLVFGGILIAAAGAWWMSLAPSPLPVDAPLDQFSAGRAIQHSREMAREAHPGGSHANEKVYDYIADQLQLMNVEMTVERPIMVRDRGRTVERNGAILARVPGTASTGAFAVDAHFDSTPYGPGAADDVGGIAAMLEAIRVLKANPPLQNDVLFCFADKEEMGGDGGPGVFMQHPWFKDVRVLLGLETRGTSGPALMFETSAENGFVIRQLALSEAKPRATSAMFDFYDRMPFGSDFCKYKKENIPGLNIAYIDNFCYYHTKLDTPENTSLASMQHHGAHIVGLARQLGNISLADCRAPNAVYFNTIGSHMVVYPFSWEAPLAFGAGAVALLALIWGLVKKRLTLWGMLSGLGVYLSVSALSLVITVPLAALVYFQFKEHALYRNNSLSAAQACIAIGLFLLAVRLVRPYVRPQNLLAGALTGWLAFLGLLHYHAPYGSYAAVWSIGFLVLALAILYSSRDREQPSARTLGLAVIPVAPIFILLVPGLVVISYALTALAVPGMLLLLLLLVAALAPQMYLLPPKFHTQSGVALVCAGIVLFAYGWFSNTPSPDRPRQNCLSYAVNFDTNEAWWISSDTRLDEWTRKYFVEDAPRESLAEFLDRDNGPRYLKAPAPMPPFEKTTMTLLEERTDNGRRFVKFHIDSPRDAQEIEIRLESDVPVFNARALGKKVRGADKDWRLTLETIPFEGGELEIETLPGQPLTFRLRETSYALPDIPGFVPRPDDMMTQPNRVLERHKLIPSSHTFSLCTHVF